MFVCMCLRERERRRSNRPDGDGEKAVTPSVKYRQQFPEVPLGTLLTAKVNTFV